METRAQISRLAPHCWLINDAGKSTCYVVTGSHHAAVIDTLNGAEDLHAIVRSITDLPLYVINTHGHLDHVGCNACFDEVWIHPADRALCLQHFGFLKNEPCCRDREHPPIRELAPGQIFDLGDRQLEVISIPGHTPGSVGLLDRADRTVYTGDAINPHMWLQLKGSMTIADFAQLMEEVLHTWRPHFDRILGGHARGYDSADRVEKLLKGCREILAGDTAADSDYVYFGGTCRQHPYPGVRGEVIVYRPECQ